MKINKYEIFTNIIKNIDIKKKIYFQLNKSLITNILIYIKYLIIQC